MIISHDVLPTLSVVINVVNSAEIDWEPDGALELEIVVNDVLHNTSKTYTKAIDSEIGSWFFVLKDLHATEDHTLTAKVVDENGQTGIISSQYSFNVEQKALYPEIVRQAIYEVIKENITDIYIYEDENWHKPIAISEDSSFSVLPLLHINPAWTKSYRHISPVFDEIQINCGVSVYCPGLTSDDGVVNCDKFLQKVRGILKKIHNLNISRLGIVNYSHEYQLFEPEMLETENNAVFLFLQQMEIIVNIKALVPNFTD